MEKHIRFATPDDAESILEIYAYYILNTTITFETTVPDIEEFRQRMAKSSTVYPYLVYVEKGEIIGYAYAYRQMTREAYRFSCTVSVYLRHGHQGKKLGVTLYSCLLGLLSEQGVWNVYATVTVPNPQSLRLHAKFGFEEVARLSRIGYKMGAWLDVVCLVKRLVHGDGEPREIIPVHKLPSDLLQLLCPVY